MARRPFHMLEGLCLPHPTCRDGVWSVGALSPENDRGRGWGEQNAPGASPTLEESARQIQGSNCAVGGRRGSYWNPNLCAICVSFLGFLQQTILIWWLKAAEMYSLWFWRSKVRNQHHWAVIQGWQGCASLGGPRGGAFLPLPASGGCGVLGLWPHRSDLCLSLHVASSLSVGPISLCLLLMLTAAFRAHQDTLSSSKA